MSPILFFLYLNDLEIYLSNHGYEGVTPVSDKQNDDINIPYTFSVCIYTDDTALLTSAADLQNVFKISYLYCKIWKLQINSNNTNIFNGTTREYRHIFRLETLF